MTLLALINLIQSLLYYVILFFLGMILSNSEQLRNYLGLKSKDEQKGDYNKTSYWIENIGKVVMLIAVIGTLVSIITTIIIFL